MADPAAPALSLVFALCHEVGNLLAASRLHAHLLRDAAADTSDADPSRSIAAIAARGGSLLAQVRPLLAPASQPPESLDAIDVLDALQREVEAPGLERLDLDLRSALDLPAVRAPSEVVHHLLLTALFGALDEAGAAAAPVRLSAERRAGTVAFCLAYEGAAGEDAGTGPLCGRRLERACADAILRNLGGGVEVEHGSGWTRVAYCIPVL